MKNEDFIYVTSNSFLWHRLLRRSVDRSVRCSAIQAARPLPGGVEAFTNEEMMKGVDHHTT